MDDSTPQAIALICQTTTHYYNFNDLKVELTLISLLCVDSFVISGIPLPFSSLWCYGQARDSWEPIDITIPSDHFPLTVIIPIFGLVQRLDFANTSVVRRAAALTPRLTLS